MKRKGLLGKKFEFRKKNRKKRYPSGHAGPGDRALAPVDRLRPRPPRDRQAANCARGRRTNIDFHWSIYFPDLKLFWKTFSRTYFNWEILKNITYSFYFFYRILLWLISYFLLVLEKVEFINVNAECENLTITQQMREPRENLTIVICCGVRFSHSAFTLESTFFQFY